MSATAVQERIEELMGSMATVPSLSVPPIANDNSRDQVAGGDVDRELGAASRDLAQWRSAMLAIVARLEDILEDVQAEFDADVMQSLLAEPVAVMMAKLQEAVSSVDAAATRVDLASQAEIGAPAATALQRRQAGSLAQKMRAARDERDQAFRDIGDRIQRIVWDFDPDSRGGPAFTESRELLAFLKS